MNKFWTNISVSHSFVITRAHFQWRQRFQIQSGCVSFADKNIDVFVCSTLRLSGVHFSIVISLCFNLCFNLFESITKEWNTRAKSFCIWNFSSVFFFPSLVKMGKLIFSAAHPLPTPTPLVAVESFLIMCFVVAGFAL